MRLTQEQEELRSAVRSLLTQHQDESAWAPLATQIGAAGLAVPEGYGGAGGGARDVHVLMEELGRSLSPLPCLGSAVLTVGALLASGDREACGRLLPGLAAGSSVGTLAWAEHGSWDLGAVRAEAAPCPGGGWLVTGAKEHVLDWPALDVVLVAARTAAGVSLFEVVPGAAGVRREPVVTMDGTRAQARWVLDGAEGRLLGADGDGARVLEHVRDLACAALAAEQVGAAGRCLELTVEYTRDRVQFGRAIGSFQAVKHRLADAYVLVESARSAALGAAFAADEDPGALPRAAAVAKSVCSEAFSAVAGEMIQLHGGIGITWEHDAHRFFKRAHGAGELFGPPAQHRARLAAGLGLAAR
ncbi:acyl-CoA dehydrogenase family protein [Streptomyces sp. NBC_00338]|uniref:acyl-CoA dehydrogenase family protein n=1 Tax=Streptomyces sp. NBC_00338 TaxID=2975715 RepID=UPI00224F0B7B|nr:acyl-CoA dehydrogenase family protein [Streptomyces sp. NBC_00338]MCX5138837.1 acyl-CoA dehydrogenase family protein [Streptomyces sp. NBC_00338]